MSACPSPAKIDEYAGGGLPPQERQAIEAHCEGCPSCCGALIDLEIDKVLPPQASEASIPASMPGRTIGHYRLVRELGRGAQGRVYLAEDTRLPRKVALKVFPASLLDSQDATVRFEREAAALSKLDHPGICAVHEVGEVEGCPFLAMRYVEGQTLGQRIARLAEHHVTAASLAPDVIAETIECIERAAKALHVAHEAGFIHRDIKPSNIMITPDGQPVILDFGLVKDKQGAERTLTRTGDVAGTPAYMSPEQIVGGHARVDRRSDVFALGVTLYEALTLRLPFDAPTTPGVFQEILTGAAPDPSRSNPQISRDLRVILETAIEKDPHRRYQTALALAEDLRRFRCHETILARPAGPALRVRRWTQRNPQVAISLTAAFVILAVSLGTAIVFLEKAQNESKVRAELLSKEEGLRLAFQSSTVLSENPGLAMLLAIEAAKRAPSLAANTALLGALESCRERARLLDHSGNVTYAAFSPDDELVATASTDRTARVWRTRTGELVTVARGHEGSIRTVDFAPDGKKILTASLDGTARVWDAFTGAELHRFKGNDRQLRLARFSPDGAIVLGLGDDTVQLWQSDAPTLLGSLADSAGPLLCARFSPDGKQLAIGTASRSVWILSVSSKQVVQRLEGHEADVLDVDWSADSSRLIAGCSNGSARVWSTTDGRVVSVLNGHTFGIYSVALTPDGARAATGSEDFSARIWDAGTGKGLFVLPHEHKVIHAELSRDGRYLLTASYDRFGRVWDMQDGKLLASFKGHAAPLLHASFSRDGASVVTTSVDATARIWAVLPAQPVPVIPPLTQPLGLSSIDPRGRHFATTSLALPREATIVDIPSGELKSTLKGHADSILAMSTSSDGTRILTSSQDRTARIWDVTTGETLRELLGHTGPVTSAKFSDDDRRVVTGSKDGTVWVWEVSTGKGRPLVSGLAAEIWGVNLSPDQTVVSIALVDGRIRIVDAMSGEVRLELSEANSPATVVEWSPDSKRLITGSPSTRAQLRDAKTGAVIGVLVHPSRVTAAKYSFDGRRINTRCEDRILRIWDAESLAIQFQIKKEGYQCSVAWFDPDGQSITVHFLRSDERSTRDSLVVRYSFDLLGEALKHKPGALTTEDWNQLHIGAPKTDGEQRSPGRP